MARVNAPLLSFNAGEVSKLALARVDIAKLRLAAQCQVNWLPWVMGPMMLRPGLMYVGEVLDDAPAKLVPFVFSKLDTALIELTANVMRIWIDEVLLARPSVTTTIADGLFTGTALTAATDNTTASGNATLHFASVPAGVIAGITVTDTTAAVIPAGTTVLSTTATTVVISANAAGAGVGSGDTIAFGGWVVTGTTSGATATFGNPGLSLTCVPVSGLAQVQQTVAVPTGSQGVEHGLQVVVNQGPVTCRIGSAAGLADLLAQTSLDTGTHSLSFVPSAAFTIQIETTNAAAAVASCTIEAAGPVEVTTPWAAADLANIRYDQSGDIIYVACHGQQQQKIERRGTAPAARGWSVALYHADDGPFEEAPGIEANLIPGNYYGQTTLTSDRPWFQPGHVGALFRLFTSNQYNAAILGGSNAFGPAVRVVGVGATARNYNWLTSGTWSGTLSFQRSFDSATDGFVTVSTATSNGSPTFISDTGGTSGSPDLDNAIAWERVGFEPGNYVSGSITVLSDYQGGGGYGICRVTGFNSSTSVNIDILEPFTSVNPTQNWVEQQWSAVQGFPTSVAFHEGRLGWFGSDQLWLSASNDYTSFADINLDGTSPGDAGAINVTLGSGPVDDISWGLSLTRLLIGREQSIGSCRSDNFDAPLTPTEIVIRDCSDQGAQRLAAVKLGKRGVFVQQSGARVYELAFNPQEMDYDDRDLTRLNLDIGRTGFTRLVAQIQPDHMLWLPRGDGTAACLLYDVKDEVEAWWRLQTAGFVEDACVLPQAGLEDLVYFVVRRILGGGRTVRYIEKLAPRANCVGAALNYQADCMSAYSGAPISTWRLPQLPLCTVVVWADGAPIGTAQTDADGNFTMPDGNAHANIVAGLGGAVVSAQFSTPASALYLDTSAYNGFPAEVFADIGATGIPVHIGPLTVEGGWINLPAGSATVITAVIGYAAPFLSAKLGYGAQLGTPINQVKKVDHLGLVLFDTAFQGLQYGQRFDQLDEMPLIEDDQLVAAGTVWPEYDKPTFELAGEWNTDARLALLATAPVPCTVGGAVVSVKTNER
jgi:hypothetical protein